MIPNQGLSAELLLFFVLVTRLTVGDDAFSSSLPGSACTVTLMRHGLALAVRGVLMIMDLEGEESSMSEKLSLLFCLPGEVAMKGCFWGVCRHASSLLSFVEMASGSGLES